MRNRTKVDLTADTIVIVIDLFANGKNPHPLTKGIIDTIRKKQVKGALLAIYDSKNIVEDKFWLERRPKDIFKDNKYIENQPYSWKWWTTCPDIISWRPRKNSNKIICPGFSIEDLSCLLRRFPNTKNVLIAGDCWEECVRFRPLGLKYIIPFLKEKDINLICNFDLIHVNQVLEKNPRRGQKDKKKFLRWRQKLQREFILENEIVWEHIEGSTYLLPDRHYDRYLSTYIDKYEEWLQVMHDSHAEEREKARVEKIGEEDDN